MTGLSPTARMLVAGRLAVGASSWVAPDLVARALGIDPRRNPQGPYVLRLFAVRDVALALGIALSEGEARRTWLKLAAFCDAGDAVAAAAGGRGGYLPPMTTVLGGVAAVGGVVAGARALAEADPSA